MDARLYNPDADAKIIDWRLGCFMRLGFSKLDASALSVRRDIDRQRVQDLRDSGCGHAMVMDIVL